MFRFSKEVACRLRQLRKTAQLTQSEVAIRMGSKGKSGHSFIVRLENGKIKHPALETILNYLDAVGVSWGTFFIELSILRSKQMHTEIMSQVKLPSDWKAQKKLDRDTFLYETKIKPPQNYYTKVDLDLVKQKIKSLVESKE
jgi:transcriptional regulator with XRE-family HTH domain